MAEACRAVGCALLGGETAEMPGVYQTGAYDVAGTIVGMVDRNALLPQPTTMQAGDLLIGLPSSGPHTNGYSLIRRLIVERDLQEPLSPGGPSLADALLAPHRCYVAEIDRIQQAGIALKGMAHITGGGFQDNIPRVLPDHLKAVVETTRWPRPPLFRQLLAWGQIAEYEAFRIFNMGIGMILIADPAAAREIDQLIPGAVTIGELAARGKSEAQVELRG